MMVVFSTIVCCLASRTTAKEIPGHTARPRNTHEALKHFVLKYLAESAEE